VRQGDGGMQRAERSNGEVEAPDKGSMTRDSVKALCTGEPMSSRVSGSDMN
jgi:hypothetical protein